MNRDTDTGEFSSIHSAERLKTIFHYTSGGIADTEQAKRLIRSKYGLGDRRTIDQAIEFSGMHSIYCINSSITLLI